MEPFEKLYRGRFPFSLLFWKNHVFLRVTFGFPLPGFFWETQRALQNSYNCCASVKWRFAFAHGREKQREGQAALLMDFRFPGGRNSCISAYPKPC